MTRAEAHATTTEHQFGDDQQQHPSADAYDSAAGDRTWLKCAAVSLCVVCDDVANVCFRLYCPQTHRSVPRDRQPDLPFHPAVVRPAVVRQSRRRNRQREYYGGESWWLVPVVRAVAPDSVDRDLANVHRPHACLVLRVAGYGTQLHRWIGMSLLRTVVPVEAGDRAADDRNVQRVAVADPDGDHEAVGVRDAFRRAPAAAERRFVYREQAELPGPPRQDAARIHPRVCDDWGVVEVARASVKPMVRAVHRSRGFLQQPIPRHPGRTGTLRHRAKQLSADRRAS